MIYLDAGSGATVPVSSAMISKVASNINIPLIVGGGINSPQKAAAACAAGADIIVVGNAIEKDQEIIRKIAEAIHTFKS
jgi:putative glycerol-1-phosphate prenyltransferase